MRKIYAVVFLIGLLMVLGTAGSVDLDRISMTQAFVQVSIGLAGMVIGAGGAING